MMVQPLWKIGWRFLKKLKKQNYRVIQQVPLLGLFPKKIKTLTQRDSCMLSTWLSTLFTIAKTWKHPNDELLQKIYNSALRRRKILPFAATWVDLEGSLRWCFTRLLLLLRCSPLRHGAPLLKSELCDSFSHLSGGNDVLGLLRLVIRGQALCPLLLQCLPSGGPLKPQKESLTLPWEGPRGPLADSAAALPGQASGPALPASLPVEAQTCQLRKRRGPQVLGSQQHGGCFMPLSL